MQYDLPTSLEVSGKERSIRTDFRVILDLLEIFGDVELTDEEKALLILEIFYPDDAFGMDEVQEAINKCCAFIDCEDEGTTDNKSTARLMDWKQDYKHIIAPVNRVLGQEARAVTYDYAANTGGLHWWTFLAAYQEIGDCYFAQIVSIRSKQARGKALDKSDREFYRRNRADIDLKIKYTEAETTEIDKWTRKKQD